MREGLAPRLKDMNGSNTIRTALGLLQDDPDHEAAWRDLREALGFTSEDGTVDPGELGAEELASLLEAARKAHAGRGEHEAVAALLAIEAALATGEREIDVVAQLARLRDDVLLDDAGAVAAYTRLLGLRPDDTEAEEALERAEAKRAKWRDLETKYREEAKDAGDPVFRSALLVSAAEVAYRYGRTPPAPESSPESERSPRSQKGGKSKKKKNKGGETSVTIAAASPLDDITARLEEALSLDPKSRRAAMLLERIFRERRKWEELVKMLDAFAGDVASKDEKIASLLRLARVLRKRIGEAERAVAVYERVLDLSPGHPEATSALVDHFTAHSMWDHLVSLYDGQLSGGGVRAGQEVGIVFQIAMVHWRMRGKPDAAEPYFERLRKVEPAHPGMLGFFREWCAAKGEQQRLVQILSDAQRAMSDGPERAQLAAEIAQLAEEGANAQKAIEQWRNILRNDASNAAAREALKRLYRQTGAHNHLADLLRSELERVAPDDARSRLPVLRDIATIYRENIKSDSALVTVLSQIIALDPQDASAVRELARVYEALGRWRDLLTTQMRLAELEPDAGVRGELYRAIARRWLEQFSNVQNAVEAYEKLRENLPEDREAVEKLVELYGKRRAYRQLFDLYEQEAARLTGDARRSLWLEMAKIAEQRLDRGAEATRLYRQVLEETPDDVATLDALEKHAEREKDFRTVADALEKRVELAAEPAAKLALLQKLGGVYADRLEDHQASLRVWRRVLELSPGHTKALRILRDAYLAIQDYAGLETLYAASNDWEGLVDVLSTAADRVSDGATKVALSFRCAEIYEEKLGAPDRAFRAYERVLSVHPNDRRAAAALVPIYEREEKFARLPGIYEILLSHATDDVERRGLYRRLSEVCGHRLADRVAAFRWARKAYEVAPTDPSSLEELEQWARASGDWHGLTEALEARLSAKDVAPEERRRLQMKRAEVSAVHAGRPEDAIAAYKRLLEESPDDEPAIAGLDRLLRGSAERAEDLRWLFRHRVSRAGGDAKLALLAEWALLEEDAFGALQEAVALYAEILEDRPEDVHALRATARLLLALGDPEGAAKALQKERSLAQGDDRIAREIDLARLSMGPLKRPADALAAAKRALEIAPNDPRVIAVVEELLPLSETRAQAAVLLEAAYGATRQYGKQADILMVLVATAASKDDRLVLFGKLADVRQKLGDNEGAFEIILRAAQEYPAELDVWDRLAVLANKTHKTQSFVEAISAAVPVTGATGLPLHVEMDLAERAATLYDENLGDIDRATPYLDRILARDPANERAFHRLKQILTTRERWTDLEALYERVLAATQDPARRVDLLAEVAIIAEEITADATRAIQYYERILELEPGHEQALFALDKLYEAQERWPALADLLARRLRLGNVSDPEALKLRLGILLFNQLSDPKSALDQLEDVVASDSSIREARELVEKCLSHPDLRQRAAIILEGVYVEREEMRDLVRVLEVRLEFVTDDVEKRELLRRIAELRDERLTDDRGAFEAYGKLLPLSPGDVEARSRFLEIARRLGRVDDAAEVLTVAAKNADAPQPRADILGDVARLFEQTNQTERAEAAHRQVLDLAPEEPSIALPAARALERVYTAGRRFKDLADVLRVQVKLEDSAEERRELLARLGDITERELSDDAAAVAAWKARLEDDPADETALAALDRLYDRSGAARELVDVLRLRERHAEGESRKDLMVRVARTLGERLADVEEAILAYRAVLDDFGADRAVLGELAKLYETSDNWRDLAETLEAELGIANDTADRVALLASLGDVRRKKLGDVPEALEAYREALTLEPQDARARAAVEELLEDESARRDAADLLVPLYETEGDGAKVLRAMDIQIATEDDLEARLGLLARAVEISETTLRDSAKAFTYASRGLREGAGEPSVGAWMERVERLTAATSHYAELVQLLRDVAPDVADEEQQVEMTLRIAELARTKLADASMAKQYHRRALELRPEEQRALLALEQLYEEGGEHESLVEILDRRASIAESDDDKRALLSKKARVCEEKLQDKDRAIAAHEEALDLGLEEATIAALERLYAATQRWGDLVALHERELSADTTTRERRAALHHALGRVYERELSEMDRAFDEYAAALDEEPTHEATIASLEELMAGKVHASRAAEMLENVYLARLDWRKVMGSIEARLEASQDPDERRDLLRRLAKLHEEQEENYRAALDTVAKLLAEDVADEATIADLERLARVANAEARLAEIYAEQLEKVTSDEPATARLAFRTGELLEAQGSVDRALSFYRRAYQFSPEDEQQAFSAIDRLLQKTSRPAERVTLYKDALEYRTAPEDRVATLHAIASIEEKDLGDDDAGITTLRSVLEVDDTDAHALDTLGVLYTRRERFRDLAELLRRRAEQSALPEEEARFRLDLARVLVGRLAEEGGAIDELEAVLGLVSPHATETGKAAVVELETLLASEGYRARVVELLRPIHEQADDWRKLVELSEHRLGIATTPHEKVAVLRETARLLEERGNDLDSAFTRLVDAFVLDPDDGDTREELDRLAVATKRWDDLAGAYEKGIERIDGIGQRELLESLAKLHDKRRDDPRKALDAWERLFRLDESDTRPLDEMDQLATLLSDWPALVRVLQKRAELTNDDEERASLCRRIGEARRDMLEDPQGAIDAYERALELEPESAWTLDNLIPLYEERNDAARLVDLYRRRVELCGEFDEELRHRLLVSAAKAYEVGLGDRREAIGLLVRALGDKPDDAEVKTRLAALYEAEKMWPELLENLRAQAAGTSDEAERAAITKRIGRLLASELDEPGKALDAYAEVLGHGYDAEAVSAVLALGDTRDELRARAADVLEPVLRTAGKHPELVKVLELRLRAQTEPSDRSATLRALANVHESWLADLGAALEALLRAVAETPSDASLHEEAERVAANLGKGGWQKLAEALADRAASIFDAKVTADLFFRLGNVAEKHLEELPRAADAYARSAEQGGDGVEVLSALERVYARLDEPRALADVLERRIAVESEPGVQAELLHRLASLQVGPLGDKAQGLATLRLALEKDPQHEKSRQAVEALLVEESLFDDVFETLEGVYRATSRGADLGRLYARRVDRASGARARTRARLDHARVLEIEANDPEGAQRAIAAAVLEDPTDREAVDALEAIATKTNAWSDAAEAFGKALETADRAARQGSSSDVSAVASVSAELWARLGRWRRDRVEDYRGAELAFTRALEQDRDDIELVRAVEELTRGPGRERDRLAVLRRLVRLDGEPAKKRELCREVVDIAENVLADSRLAEDALRELLEENESDAWAYEQLTRLREEASDHEQVITLLVKRAELAEGATEASTLRHRAAEVAAEKQNDKARAIALYEQIYGDDASDHRAKERLRSLYAETERFQDLAKLLRQLIEAATSVEERGQLRIELAQLSTTRFGATQDAIDTLRAVLEEDADHEAAATELARVLEEAGKNGELAELQASRVERARVRGDVAAEVSAMLRLGAIYEEKVGDPGAALETYEQVATKDPDQREALEAVARLAESRSKWEQAASALARLVETASGARAVELALRLAKARGELGDTAGVEQALERALSAEPANADVRAQLAKLYERTKKWAELASLLVGDADMIRDAHGEEPANGSMASLPPAAAKTSMPPTVVPAHIASQVQLLKRAAELHVKERGSPDDAVPILERASRLLPQDRELLLSLCDAYSASKRDRDAATVLERIIASFGGKRSKELSIYHHRLGRALASLGDKPASLTQLDMAFKIDPGSIEVLRDLGVLALETNDLDRAQKTFRALLLQRLDPGAGISKGEVFTYLGEISMRQGDKAKAVQMLERAVENEPNLARAKQMLGELKG